MNALPLDFAYNLVHFLFVWCLLLVSNNIVVGKNMFQSLAFLKDLNKL